MLDHRHLAVLARGQDGAGERRHSSTIWRLAVEPVQDQDGVGHLHARRHPQVGDAPQEGAVELGEGVGVGVGAGQHPVALAVGQVEGVGEDHAPVGQGGVELTHHHPAVVEDEQPGAGAGPVEHVGQTGGHAVGPAAAWLPSPLLGAPAGV